MDDPHRFENGNLYPELKDRKAGDVGHWDVACDDGGPHFSMARQPLEWTDEDCALLHKFKCGDCGKTVTWVSA